ncbi:MAG: GAF domain-containing protein, partial [Deltaproteobacteria bacterium]
MKGNDSMLDALLQITQISNMQRVDFQTKLHRIVHEIAKCMKTERASIMIKKGRNHLIVEASTVPGLVGHKIPLAGESPSVWVVKNKKVLYVKDSSEKSSVIRQSDHYHKNAFCLSPIMIGNKVIGVISITEKIGLDSFSIQEQEGFVLLSGYILSTLENHRLTESLRKGKSSLRKTNQELKRLEKLRTELFNMLIHDLKGPISEVIANLDLL